ncbi:DUF1648 domain-containing protein [Staphylococcus hominis]|uniref:DUF1648 domain-containing protein n=1 Tax=Staphylococcus hominis TaxID=1290 RepID=UPI001BCECD83|nr:DUF1648 domain-containing protein [Staphylococcus hominis]
MKEKLKQSWFSLLVIAITIVTWLIALPFLPNDIPMQYNDVGNVTWRTNKFISFFINIAIMLFCYIVLNDNIFFRNTNQYQSDSKKLSNKLVSSVVQIFIYIIFLIIIFESLRIL